MHTFPINVTSTLIAYFLDKRRECNRRATRLWNDLDMFPKPPPLSGALSHSPDFGEIRLSKSSQRVCYLACVNSFRTAVPFWDKSSLIRSNLSPKRYFGSERVKKYHSGQKGKNRCRINVKIERSFDSRPEWYFV